MTVNGATKVSKNTKKVTIVDGTIVVGADMN
jgi:hypothetical protein